MCKLALGHPKQPAQLVQDTKPNGQTGSNQAPRWDGRWVAMTKWRAGAPRAGTRHKGPHREDKSETRMLSVQSYIHVCPSLKLQQFVYTVPERVFSNASRNGTFGSTMSSVVCCRKMKGEPAFVKSCNAGKHSMIHFPISVNTTLFQGFPVIINHKG